MKSSGVFALSVVMLAVYGGLFVYICVRHTLYPGFIEPMEGAVLAHVERVAGGLALYPMPDGEFIAITYMPLYFIVSAPLFDYFGDSFLGPRLLSCASAVAAGAILWWIARRESGSSAVACIAAGLYFAGYRLMDAWLTCALPDSLVLLWLLLGFCYLAYGKNWFHDLLWILFFTLAFWTKQQGAFYFGFAVLYAVLLRKNSLPRWSLVLGMILGGPVAYWFLGQYLGDGFFYHTLTVPGRWERSVVFSLRRNAFVLFCYIPYVCVLSAYYVAAVTTWRPFRTTALAWFTVTAFLVTAFTLMASGSSNNHYIPFMAILCVTAALGAQQLSLGTQPKRLIAMLLVIAVGSIALIGASTKVYGVQYRIPLFAGVVTLVVPLLYLLLSRFSTARSGGRAAAVLIVGQLVLCFYLPNDYLESPGYREDIDRLQEELAGIDGEIVWPLYGNVPATLTGVKLLPMPSRVIIQDVERQQGVESEVEKELAPLRDRLRNSDGIYVLSTNELRRSTWNHVPGEFELIRDYGDAFSAAKQITRHWFDWGTNSYPRYLYRWHPNR